MRTGVLGLICAPMLLTACGQTAMVKTTGEIREHMVHRNYAAALQTLNKSKRDGFKEQDRVVYWMNEGMLLHLLGRYKDSSRVLHKAEARAEELFTTKVSKEIKAAFTSQAATDYRGEDYENVLVHVLKAFNFLGANNVEGALVEARKINNKLALYNTKYERKNVYNQDAFAHWLTGLLYEIERSYDDARISYKKAMQVYDTDFATNYGLKAPPYLREDLVRASLLSRARGEAEKYRKKYGKQLGKTSHLIKTHGEVVLMHLNGEGPTKSDYFVTCFFHDPANWHCDGEPGGEFIKRTTIHIPPKATVVKVAFPQLHTHKPANPYLELEVAGKHTRSFAALPINGIAAKCMADKMHRIWKNAIIRVVTKAATTEAAGAAGKAAGGGLLGGLMKKATSAAMQATEEADKRAWTTLPARIEVARLWVSPGVHNVIVHLPRGGKATIGGVKVGIGKRVVITYRTLP